MYKIEYTYNTFLLVCEDFVNWGSVYRELGTFKKKNYVSE